MENSGFKLRTNYKDIIVASFSQVVLKADEPTANGTIYSKDVLEKAILEFNNKEINFGPIVDKDITLKKVGFSVLPLTLIDDKVICKIELLNNIEGNRISKLLESKRFKLTPVGEGRVCNNIVEDYKLIGFSISPALPDMLIKETKKENNMKLFEFRREVDSSGVSGTGVVAQDVIFSNGKCAVNWLTEHSSIIIYDSIEDVIAIHGHGGNTKFIQIFDSEGIVEKEIIL